MNRNGKSEILKALGHPTRLQIAAMLLEEPRCVGELGDLTGCQQANTSHHLHVLYNAGIVEEERSGTVKNYSIRREIRPTIEKIIEAL